LPDKSTPCQGMQRKSYGEALCAPHHIFEQLPRFEFGLTQRRDGDFLTGARVAPDRGGPFHDLK